TLDHPPAIPALASTDPVAHRPGVHAPLGRDVLLDLAGCRQRAVPRRLVPRLGEQLLEPRPIDLDPHPRHDRPPVSSRTVKVHSPPAQPPSGPRGTHSPR